MTSAAGLESDPPVPGADGSPAPLSDQDIAQALREMATLLQAQGGLPYRAAAYRRAADRLVLPPESLRQRYEREGLAGLEAVSGIDRGIALAIAEMLSTGGWNHLELMRGDADPVLRLRRVPGVGAALAHRVHETLGIETLEGLEAAARDGRLETVPRVGARRAAAIGAALAAMLGRRRAAEPAADAAIEPPVSLLLEVDRQYRAAAEAGTLPTVAPRRHNPEHRAWLPVLHTRVDDWQFTALYANTARAHEVHRVRDWVVVRGEHDIHGERQYTVITALRGPLAGRRVVRGREAECHDWHPLQGAA